MLQDASSVQEQRIEMFAAWTGLASILLLLIALGTCYLWIMPLDPSRSAAEIAQVSRENLIGIEVGFVLTWSFAALLMIPFFALISHVMLRIEDAPSMLATTQIVAGAISILLVIIQSAIFGSTDFHVGRPIELHSFGYDMSWLVWNSILGPAQIQMLAIAIAVLADRRLRPILPRWYGYLCVWSAIIIAPTMPLYSSKPTRLRLAKSWHGMWVRLST